MTDADRLVEWFEEQVHETASRLPSQNTTEADLSFAEARGLAERVAEELDGKSEALKLLAEQQTDSWAENATLRQQAEKYEGWWELAKAANKHVTGVLEGKAAEDVMIELKALRERVEAIAKCDECGHIDHWVCGECQHVMGEPIDRYFPPADGEE